MKTGKDVWDYTESFQRGEEKGFTYFFNNLYPALVYFCFRILNDKDAAEDVVDETFIKIWERHQTFTHPQVIKSWLYISSRNACLNVLAQKGRRNEHKKRLAEQMECESEDSILSKIIIAEVIAEMHKYIRILPSQCKTIFEHLYIKGHSVRETSNMLKLSISTIKNQKARGLDIIRKKYNIAI